MKKMGKSIYLIIILFIGVTLGSMNVGTSHDEDIQDDVDDFEPDIQDPDNDYTPPEGDRFVEGNIMTDIAKNTNNIITSIFGAIGNIFQSIIGALFG